MKGPAVEIHASVDEIDPSGWDACFPDEPEGWAYLRAVEHARIPGFESLCLVAKSGGEVLAAVPAFITRYNLATTIQGRAKDLLAPLIRRAQGLLSLELLCLGSPLTDRCTLGFLPSLSAADRAAIAGRLLAAADEVAEARGIGLVAVKDLCAADVGPDMERAFAQAGFARQPSLPNAVLDLQYADEGAYLASLSSSTRREVRRKLKGAGRVTMELRRGPDALGFIPHLMRLYEAQRTASSVDFEQFETLTPAYFSNVLCGKLAALVWLFRNEGEVVGFNLCYHSRRVFVDKFVGFEPGRAREFNLYVLNWMANVRYCIEHGIATLQTGQTGYAMKRRLGSTLEEAWIYFRHRNRAANAALRMASPLLAADRYDADLSVGPPRK